MTEQFQVANPTPAFEPPVSYLALTTFWLIMAMSVVLVVGSVGLTVVYTGRWTKWAKWFRRALWVGVALMALAVVTWMANDYFYPLRAGIRA